jgi:N-acetylmuramoyl-L-alanine amidase
MLVKPTNQISLAKEADLQAPEAAVVNENSVLEVLEKKQAADGDTWLRVRVVAGLSSGNKGFIREQRTQPWRLPVPTTANIDRTEFATAATIAARTFGINRDLLIAIGLIRTSITDINETVPGGEAVVGPFGFSESEWVALSLAHPIEVPFNESNNWRRHVGGAALLMGEHVRELERSLGRPATSTELYLAHLVGSGAAAAVIKQSTAVPQPPIGNPLREFYTAAGNEAQASAVLERYTGLFRDGANERSVKTVLEAMATQLSDAIPKVADIVALLPEEDRGGAVGADGEPPWMAIARGELEKGVRAFAVGSNPDIEKYHEAAGGRASDDVAWCSSFVNWCIRESHLHGIEPTQNKMARSWLNWGEAIDALVPGCVVVLRRGDHPQGHVAFFERWEDGKMMLLGGNQSNAVSIVAFLQGDVLPGGMPTPRDMTPLSAAGQRDRDIDTLARTLWGEARGESPEGREAIAAVVLNRLKRGLPSRFGDSIAGVCKHRQQFSCWNEGDPNLEQLRSVTTEDATFRECLDTSTRAADGQLADPTEGSDHYHTVDVSPEWSRGKTPIKTIGHHQFFNNIE